MLILGPEYESYEQALEYLHIDALYQIRENYALTLPKMYKIEQHEIIISYFEQKILLETK